MPKRLPSRRVLLALVVVAVATVAGIRWSNRLTIHEWGTFTTVAGDDGRAIDWYPAGGPTDLPCFVERLAVKVPGNRGEDPGEAFTVVGKDTVPIRTLPGKFAGMQWVFYGQPHFDYAASRANVLGKVRMETPVIYFYSPTEGTAHVRVDFPRGVMTEWYPRATVVQDDVSTATLRDSSKRSTIWWTNLAIRPTPSALPTTATETSHYFAARETDAVPVATGGQTEKFLFYRGIGNFDVPIAAQVAGEGAIHITNLGTTAIPTVVLFENRGGRIGFRTVRNLKDTVTLQAPTLDGTFDSLRVSLGTALVATGLYPKEAAAMIATWKDSWFEEGTRVFYIFPQKAIDKILPLKVDPTPTSVVRTFVGRMEVLTPETISAVEEAMNKTDLVALAPYARFFGAIGDRILATRKVTQSMLLSAANDRTKFNLIANALLAEYVKKSIVCQ